MRSALLVSAVTEAIVVNVASAVVAVVAVVVVVAAVAVVTMPVRVAKARPRAAIRTMDLQAITRLAKVLRPLRVSRVRAAVEISVVVLPRTGPSHSTAPRRPTQKRLALKSRVPKHRALKRRVRKLLDPRHLDPKLLANMRTSRRLLRRRSLVNPKRMLPRHPAAAATSSRCGVQRRPAAAAPGAIRRAEHGATNDRTALIDPRPRDR